MTRIITLLSASQCPNRSDGTFPPSLRDEHPPSPSLHHSPLPTAITTPWVWLWLGMIVILTSKWVALFIIGLGWKHLNLLLWFCRFENRCSTDGKSIIRRTNRTFPSPNLDRRVVGEDLPWVIDSMTLPQLSVRIRGSLIRTVIIHSLQQFITRTTGRIRVSASTTIIVTTENERRKNGSYEVIDSCHTAFPKEE